jgi:hypothetical protein
MNQACRPPVLQGRRTRLRFLSVDVDEFVCTGAAPEADRHPPRCRLEGRKLRILSRNPCLPRQAVASPAANDARVKEIVFLLPRRIRRLCSHLPVDRFPHE